MNVALRRRTMTEAEFLAWVEPLERRYEFDGTGPVAMVGGTPKHGLIQVNLLAALHARLRGSGCRVLGSDNFTRVAGSLRLPDAVVVCRDIQNEGRVITDPSAVFEILSTSTSHIDRFAKAQEYWETASIRHYVMLEQDQMGAVVLSRGEETWSRVAVDGRGTIDLPAVGVSLPLAEIYDGLTFPEPDPDPAPV